MSTSMYVRLRRAVANTRLRDERGDVPGWVLVTITTAGIVAVRRDPPARLRPDARPDDAMRRVRDLYAEYNQVNRTTAS
jgi:hypothetical protein